MNRKPMNVIVISSDEMRGDAPGFMGNPDCLTPNLDRLAQRSVVFTNHFTVHGKCVPARCAMMTGRYCHTDAIRTVNHDNQLPPGTPNLMLTLKQHGYETAFFGHNHTFEDLNVGNNFKGEGIADYHSFTVDYFEPLTHRQHPVAQPDANTPPAQKITPDNVNLRTLRTTEPRSGFSDDVRADQAIHYLSNIRDRNRPFFMQVNFSAPHPVYRVEEPFYSMYDPGKITPYEHAMPENSPIWMQRAREVRTRGATPMDFLKTQAVYYGMITKLDVLIGNIMKTIDAENLWENTIIMFWVDHGDFAGQHGLPEKWDTAMNDCIMHVPQTIYAPGLPVGEQVESLTEHTDICPTVLELLGINPPPDWVIHGQSLLPVIRGEITKDCVFADGGHEAAMRKRFNAKLSKYEEEFGLDAPTTYGKQEVYFKYPETMARVKMIRTKEWKYCFRETGDHELYNLLEDPGEMKNIYGQPEYAPIVMQLQEKLLQWCLETDPDRPFQSAVVA